MDSMTKKIILIATVVVATGITMYYAWQAIFLVPLLRSIVGIAATAFIIIIEFISILRYFNYVQHKNQKQKLELRNLLASEPAYHSLPSGHANKKTSTPSYFIVTILICVSICIISILGYNIISNHRSTNLVATPPPFNSYPSYISGKGRLVFFDSLRQANAWPESSNDSFGGYCHYIHNVYHAIENQSNNANDCDSKGIYNNFTFEVEANIVHGDCGGIYIRYDPANYAGYFYELCQDGSCNFYNLTDYSSNVDCDGSAISQGLNESNLIDITAYGDNITIYVNTKETMSIQDNSYTKGVIALIAEDNGDPTEVIYSNAKIWT